MKIDIKKEIAALTEETIEIRRDIHMHPELGFREFRTAEIIEKRLEQAGLRVRRCAGTGVIGVLEGGLPGPTIMLRSDMDALPILEENNLPYCSVNPGVMHACGHDGHVAMQLQAAKIFSAHREELPGTVVFLFQPNEEDVGAPQMIEDGALSDPRPEAIVGIHLAPTIDTGAIGLVSGPCCASSYYFKVTIYGKDTHGCTPEFGVSPIEAGRHVLEAINSMQTMEYSTLSEPTLITAGSIHSGDYMNIIPSELAMEGSIRCLHPNEKAVHTRFRELVTAVCAAYRCTCDIQITCGNNLLDNDEALYELVRGAAKTVVGSDNITSAGVREMGGDDIAEFFREGIPGIYYLIGTGNEKKASTAAQHSRDFRIDEDSLDIGIEMQIRVILSYLGV